DNIALQAPGHGAILKLSEAIGAGLIGTDPATCWGVVVGQTLGDLHRVVTANGVGTVDCQWGVCLSVWRGKKRYTGDPVSRYWPVAGPVLAGDVFDDLRALAVARQEKLGVISARLVDLLDLLLG